MVDLETFQLRECPRSWAENRPLSDVLGLMLWAFDGRIYARILDRERNKLCYLSLDASDLYDAAFVSAYGLEAAYQALFARQPQRMAEAEAKRAAARRIAEALDSQEVDYWLDAIANDSRAIVDKALEVVTSPIVPGLAGTVVGFLIGRATAR